MYAGRYRWVIQYASDDSGKETSVGGATRNQTRPDHLARTSGVGSGQGPVSVRRMQMALLEKGNPTMAIWLGKNLLGQSDDGPLPEHRPSEFDDIEIDE